MLSLKTAGPKYDRPQIQMAPKYKDSLARDFKLFTEFLRSTPYKYIFHKTHDFFSHTVKCLLTLYHKKYITVPKFFLRNYTTANTH